MDIRDGEKLARIEELSGQPGIGSNDLQAVKEIIQGRIKCKDRLIVGLFPEDAIKSRLRNGEPAVRRDSLNFSPRKFFQYLVAVQQVFRKYGVLNGQRFDFQRYMEEYEKAGLDLAEMLDRLSGQGALFQLLILQGLKPVYEKYSEMYGSLYDESAWLRPYCYICGGEPDMATIEGDDNRKYLHCGLCDTSWRYPRFECPFCGTTDQTKLVSFSTEDASVYTVDGCQECGRYLKVADARVPGRRVFVEIESVLSSHLDAAARNEGFVS